MNQQPHTLVCTVGTSLFHPNLDNLDQRLAQNTNVPWAESLQACKEAYELRNWTELGRALVPIPVDDRLCGAEINSIAAMVRRGFLGEDRARLILLVSETEEGKAIGQVLKTYFEHEKCPLRFQAAVYKEVKGLQDADPERFRRDGLCNLVRSLGHEIRQWGANHMAINATGGYKAQIALAVALGQAARCAVYYKHERFDQVIRFPQVPFSLDLTLVHQYKGLWADLAEPDNLVRCERLDQELGKKPLDREAIEPMLEKEDVDSHSFVALSALGLVYWEAYLTQNPKTSLTPPMAEKRHGCKFRDDHYPKGFKDYVQRVYEAFPKWVNGCHSVPYSGQASMEHKAFYEKDRKIYGEYVDRNGFGARFEVTTTAQNALHRRYVVEELRRWAAAKP